MELDLSAQLEEILQDARNEHFEDGRISNFERAILKLYETQDPGIFLGYFFRLLDLETNLDVLHEALKILAYLDDPKVAFLYRGFVEQHLVHDNPLVRDGALTALEYINDPESIPVLLQFLKVEKISYLHRYAQKIAEQIAGLLPPTTAVDTSPDRKSVV